MPPSVVLVASACESPFPGACGSLNGSWVAGAVGVDGWLAEEAGGAAPFPPSNRGALAASGARGLTRIVGLSRSRPPLTTNSAGCSLVGPRGGVLLGGPAAGDLRDRGGAAGGEADRRGHAGRAGHGGGGAHGPERADER